ncbi:Putative BTB/POZ domain-containing protein [Septoria linicola]|uniref:BTB/POZ domain-containing protein n=1 Tax=Septoria linicola TaxID=215465 RepID=A0A9Q9EK98_9PEZI|nr:putative BTB/POZ domain-containing protein [Septoria linicola]USW52173.1 Putative BTB/POZ domain-containing protein [Septoria linicola]
MAQPSNATESHAQDELMHALAALHIGGKYSDLTIRCDHRQWAVHKAIVCPRSGFFDGACSHQFREAMTGVVDLSGEDDPNAVEQMIHYLYYLDYMSEDCQRGGHFDARHRRATPKEIDFSQIEDPLLAQAGFYEKPASTKSTTTGGKIDQSSSLAGVGAPQYNTRDPCDDEQSDTNDDVELGSNLVLHAQIYALGEKYDIPSLKHLAIRKFEVAAACYYDSPELADAIDFVYRSTIDTDRGLRNVVLQMFKLHPQLANTQDIYATIRDTPGLALDLWKAERGLI